MRTFDRHRRQLAGDLLERLLDASGIPASRSQAPHILDLLCGGPRTEDQRPAGPESTNDLQFGVTEFSLSLAPDRTHTIRCLAEVTSRGPASTSDLRTAGAIGRDLFRFLSQQYGAAYPLQTFEDVYHLIYVQPDESAPRPHHRFGVAIEWSPEAPPSVKCYFDLFASGQARAYQTLEAVLRRLGFDAQWLLVDRLASEVADRGFCRGVGIDFSPAQAANCRLYLAGKNYTLETIGGLLDRFEQGEQRAVLDMFQRLILNAMPVTAPLGSALVGLVFSDRLPTGCAILKLDAYLPDLKPDERASTLAVRELCSALDVAPGGYEEMLRVMAGDRPLETTQGLQQFLSLDLLPRGKSKINVYFRPFGFETPHLSPQHRPRSKSPVVDEIDRTIRRTICWLEGQRATHYPEATHRMYFPRALGFTGSSDLHEGWVFQRALICDALWQAVSSGFEVDWLGVQSDVNALVQARCREIPGGWTYFPDLPELPPDADDLAAILLVLVRSGSGAIDTLCDDPIRLLFTQNSAGDGSFSTWIVDRTDRSERTRLMRDAIETKWGDGVDVEVVANLLYALTVYDSGRFATEISRGIEYVSRRQEADGSWRSSWYCGPYTGTFACVRAISAVRPQSHTLARAASFLEATQHDDGGWGDPRTNATDTALALMTLTCLHGSVAVNPASCQRAFGYLIDHQSSQGTWPASPFIQMDTNRTMTLRGQGTPQIITYGSQTIASALCLKALSLARANLLNLG